MIVAHDKNFIIGVDGKLPWHFKTDLKFFKETTMNHHVLMGYKTYKEIIERNPHGLPGRKMIVVSRYPISNPNIITIPDYTYQSIQSLHEHVNFNDIYVIGGAYTYYELLPYCDEYIITEIDAAVNTSQAHEVRKIEYSTQNCTSEIINKTVENETMLTFKHYYILKNI